jgi:hypothetical protein
MEKPPAAVRKLRQYLKGEIENEMGASLSYACRRFELGAARGKASPNLFPADGSAYSLGCA